MRSFTLGMGALLLEVVGVDLDVLHLVIRHGVLGEDRGHRALWLARATVDALVGIDVELRVVVGGAAEAPTGGGREQRFGGSAGPLGEAWTSSACPAGRRYAAIISCGLTKLSALVRAPVAALVLAAVSGPAPARAAQ